MNQEALQHVSKHIKKLAKFFKKKESLNIKKIEKPDKTRVLREWLGIIQYIQSSYSQVVWEMIRNGVNMIGQELLWS